jgi:hypothetical protein
MPQSVTIRSRPEGFQTGEVKGIPAQGLEWDDGYRGFGREAIGAILRRQMDQDLLTELGALELGLRAPAGVRRGRRAAGLRPASRADRPHNPRLFCARTRPMGVFSDRTSIDRIHFAVFNHENRNQGVSTPLLLTQTF